MRLLCSTSSPPLVAIDTRDRASLSGSATALFARADACLLRECPLDLGTLLRGRFANFAGKIAPMSIGLSRERADEMPNTATDKVVDVFFAGQADTPLRRSGLPELRALASEGVRVEIADARMSRPEFYRRCASAWLVWSPEGRGWQCFRHLEAAACSSVPLLNRPTIRERDPLVDGMHALHYDARPSALTAAVKDALADTSRLVRISDAGRRHVLRHHTHAALCDQVLAAIRATVPG